MENRPLDKERRSDFQIRVMRRIREKLRYSGYSNSDLVVLCQNCGMPLSAPSISKMLSEPPKDVTMYNVVSLCRALGLDLNEILSPDDEVSAFPVRNRGKHSDENVSGAISFEDFLLRSDPDSLISQWRESEAPVIYSSHRPEIRQFFGHYYTYSFPTVEDEDGYLCGELTIGQDFTDQQEENRHCPVTFELETGRISRVDQTQNRKRYVGTLTLAPRLHSAHITLVETTVGEISYLSMVNPGTLYEGLKCQIAMAMTISSGGTRAPTVHRMIINRSPFSEEQLAKLKGLLYMGASEILIGEDQYAQFLKDPLLPKPYLQNFRENGADHFPYKPKRQTLIAIKEAWIEGTDMSEEDQLLSLSLLRKYSNSRKYYKLGPKVGEILFKMISGFQKREEEDTATPPPPKP